MTEPYATRREMDLFRAAADLDRAKLWTRLDSMDEHGTRGIGALQMQVSEVIKDLAGLQADTRAWQSQHHLEHERDRAERLSGRRWVVGTLIAVLAMLAAVLGVALNISSHVH